MPDRAAAHQGHSHGDGHSHGGGHEHGPHGHSHGGVDAGILRSHEAMRTLGLSLLILGVTAGFQVAIVVLSGSIALLADTVHNFGDALTAIPLAVAFVLGRRLPTRRLTYGYGRVEDLAGIAVLAIILFSAVFAAYEAVDRLINPETPTHLLAAALAGLVGFIGNEWVAVYRIRTGRRIGSAALEADGYHARIDGITSLAVVVGVLGVAAGFRLADPIVGLLISVAILRIVWRSAREIGLRALDGIEPEFIDQVRREAASVPGVTGVADVRARWLGHTIRPEVTVTVPGDQAVADADLVAEAVRHQLTDHLDFVADPVVTPRPA